MDILVKRGRRRPAIVAYDITCDKRRRQALKLVSGWRTDGQLSVHECLLTNREADELFMQLGELIDLDEDRVMLAWLDGSRPVRVSGAVTPDRVFPNLVRVD